MRSYESALISQSASAFSGGNTAPVSGKIKLGEVGFHQTDAGHKESLITTEQWVLRALACLLNVLYLLFQNRCSIYMGKP